MGPTLPIPIRVELDRPERQPDSGATTVLASNRGDPSQTRPADAQPSDTGALPPVQGSSLGRTGRYLVQSELGRGGMGVVYLAFDRDLRRQVAMKVLAGRFEASPELMERFVEEAQATAQLTHPGIVPVHEMGLTDSGQLYFTMERVEGRTLADLVAEGETSRHRRLQILIDVARTVAYAHERGVVHRDLKPHNIMVGAYGEVRVLDWGLAKIQQAASDPGGASSTLDVTSRLHETLQGDVMGTPAYMAPEQAVTTSRAGPLSDVYSLGTTLYQVLTGVPPHEAEDLPALLERVRHARPAPPRSRDRTIPRSLAAICRKSMARDPLQRYQSASALADDLQRYLEGQPVSAYAEPVLERLARTTRRFPVATRVASLGFILGIIGASIALFLISRAWQQEEATRITRDAAIAQAQEEAELKQAYGELSRAHGMLFAGDFAGSAAVLERLATTSNRDFIVEETNRLRAELLGFQYYEGREVSQDDARALHWLRQAAELQSPIAQYTLGTMYYAGRGVEQDYQKTVEWYRAAAKQGYPKSQQALGWLYQQGHGVPRDDEAALHWYRLAAANGDPVAQHNLAGAYERGKGVEPDEKQALHWYRRAAEAGMARSQVVLGVCYHSGKWVERDMEEAVRWYGRAARQGLPRAQYNLALCHLNGSGVPQDDQAAARWYRKAAQAGYGRAQFALGHLYADGRGVERDPIRAAYWWTRAAEQEEPGAMYALGLAYLEGQGVAADREAARHWLERAAKRDYPGARRVLSNLPP